MKKYFAKYLKVKEKPKIGDYIMPWGYGMKVKKVTGISKEKDFWGNYDITVCEFDDTTLGIEICPKVKLFLCSEEDHYGEPDLGIYVDAKVTGTNSFSATKIIGEISPAAVWVKEGMEFDEDELAYQQRDGYYTLISEATFEIAEGWTIMVKCSQCKKFH